MWDDPRQLNVVAIALSLAAVTAIAWGLIAWSIRQPLFALRHVVVDAPLTRANPAHIEAVVREEFKGTFFTMRLADAAASMQRVPWVRRVALRRKWPDRLEITVSEHEPLARWNDNALVNTRGEVFTADYDGELPQFRGPEDASMQVAAGFAEFGRALAPAGLTIEEARLSPRGGWQLRASGAAPITIELGRSDASERLARFVAFYPKTIVALARTGTRSDYADLRYRNGFAVRVPAMKEKTSRTRPGSGAKDQSAW
jgi:cell division protein FtsQ